MIQTFSCHWFFTYTRILSIILHSFFITIYCGCVIIYISDFYWAHNFHSVFHKVMRDAMKDTVFSLVELRRPWFISLLRLSWPPLPLYKTSHLFLFWGHSSIGKFSPQKILKTEFSFHCLGCWTETLATGILKLHSFLYTVS